MDCKEQPRRVVLTTDRSEVARRVADTRQVLFQEHRVTRRDQACDERDSMYRDEGVHVPCLLQEAVDALVTDCWGAGTYVDCTFGRGGHSREILSRLCPEADLTAFDVDPEAVRVGQMLNESDPRFTILNRAFEDIAKALNGRNVQGVLADLGVSSPQLDHADRGFNYWKHGPLDMRMNPEQGVSASEWLQSVGKDELSWVIHSYGEDGEDTVVAERIADYILEVQRKRGPFQSTVQFADVICKAHPCPRPGMHPAKLTFQAIRMYLNREEGQLRRLLHGSFEVLQYGGRFVVITFKDSEIQVVNEFVRMHTDAPDFLFKQWSYERLCESYPLLRTDKPYAVKRVTSNLRPGHSEVSRNRRARSSKLHVFVKQHRKCFPQVVEDIELQRAPLVIEARQIEGEQVNVYDCQEKVEQSSDANSCCSMASPIPMPPCTGNSLSSDQILDDFLDRVKLTAKQHQGDERNKRSSVDEAIRHKVELDTSISCPLELAAEDWAKENAKVAVARTHNVDSCATPSCLSQMGHPSESSVGAAISSPHVHSSAHSLRSLRQSDVAKNVGKAAKTTGHFETQETCDAYRISFGTTYLRETRVMQDERCSESTSVQNVKAASTTSTHSPDSFSGDEASSSSLLSHPFSSREESTAALIESRRAATESDCGLKSEAISDIEPSLVATSAPFPCEDDCVTKKRRCVEGLLDPPAKVRALLNCRIDSTIHAPSRRTLSSLCSSPASPSSTSSLSALAASPFSSTYSSTSSEGLSPKQEDFDVFPESPSSSTSSSSNESERASPVQG
eukprot:TRINITY_DN1993_c1_g6_i1.p1 TRINITY_DN1993_c1_g6~~TRINITY_DN1993_c1_g6_i1.p1  ORF type:complete len:840 (-),score=77.20 TRINITY_DN1993_c1_g6_i1:191-2563(-)